MKNKLKTGQKIKAIANYSLIVNGKEYEIIRLTETSFTIKINESRIILFSINDFDKYFEIMENNFYKQCDTCQGDAYVIINGTPNDDPQFDEREECPICNTGKVPNNEVIQECLDKWEYVVRRIIEARNERIKREEEFFYKLAEHQWRLKNKLSNN